MYSRRILCTQHRLIIPRWAKCFVLLEPFAVLFWDLALYFPTPDPARRPVTLHRCTVSISLYGHANCRAVESWFNSHRRRIAFPTFPI